MDPLSGATSVMAVVQLTASIVQICAKYLNNVKNAREDIQRLQEKTAALAHVLQSIDDLTGQINGNKLATTQDLVHNIARCSSTLVNLKDKIDPGTTQNPMRKWGLRAFKWPLARTEVDDAITELELYNTTFSLSLQVDQMRSIHSIHQKIDLTRLQTAKGATYDSYDNQHIECLAGTRINLLQEIEAWAQSPHGKCIFWLNGMAGTGKSTISRTVASSLNRQQLLGASFFFKRGEEDRATAKMLFPTLTEQLVVGIPQMLPQVQEAIDEDPNISQKVLREQFEKLLLNPLLSIKPQQGITSRVIVIDALDECDLDDIGVVLRLLPQIQKSTSVHLRFLLTSRPELPIRLGFNEITDDHQDLVLHEIAKPVIDHDISLYLEDQLLRLKQKHSLPADWPGNAATRELVDRAVPLFIAAVTLCRFIGDTKWNPQKRLEAILKDQSTYASKMDRTYIPVLKQLLTGQDETESQELLNEFKEIVGVIIDLATPLSINSLSQLVKKEPDDIKCRLDQLHSVLTVPSDFDEPVRLLHLSFRDFLLDHHRDNSEFWINSKDTNQRLAAACLRIMHNNLKKKICNLSSEGTEYNDIKKGSIQETINPELRYACRYWVHHLVQCSDLARMIEDTFLFLKTHFLHWVEALSLLRFTSETLGILDQLQTAISGHDCPPLLCFLHDAKRFFLKNSQIVDLAPLQIYCAGLIFAPQTAILRGMFEEDIPEWICQLPRVEERWGALTQTLEGHSFSVQSVAFSPNGRLLASGSSDHTVRVWDAATGALTQTLEGHSNCVQSVVFSPNGQLIASGSGDTTVRVWDAATGALTQTLEGHSRFVQSVVFSPDGRLLASGCDDATIRVWNPATGAHIQTLDSYPDWVLAMAFSADSRLLASSSHGSTVRVWDTVTGELIHTLKDYTSSVESVAFSPDGRLLVLGAHDSIVRVWEPMEGKLIQTLEGHSQEICSVAYSPDGRLIASGSGDTTVRVWDAVTGTLIQTLEGHVNRVLSVAFSPDGRLASGSGDTTVRVWDLATGPLTQTLEGHSDWIYSVAFSPDGRLLASGSDDKTVGIWDVATGALTQTLEGHSSWIHSVAFSFDGRLIASGSFDHTIRVWDAATGALIQTLTGDYVIWSIAFSPDGRLASGSNEPTIRVWDPVAGTLLQTIEDHPDRPWSVAFSADGQLLASGSGNGKVFIWDPVAGALIHTLEGHSEQVMSVAFSPDGRLASGSDDHTVRLWDPVSGALTQTWQFEEPVTRLEFSPDSLYVHTNLGTFDCQSRCDDNLFHQLHGNIGISIVDKQWIYLNGKKVLWLPVDSRPNCSKTNGNLLALGHGSGGVSFLGFCL
ncbi:hypothetical protein N7463_010046 [Penicillium fimorum]|uniref:NACHT domain-containing protein n=1 Tax=Penicillium fimorum TaxID=1882269 RepID=A0A9X0C1F0_9EURO|nr:hypothetical protein N7463_010046 [Penicillium fimorum]